MLVEIVLALIATILLIRDHKKIRPFFEKYQSIILVIAALFLISSIIVEFQQNQEKKAFAYEGTLQSDSSIQYFIMNILSPITDFLFPTNDNDFPALELGDSGTIFNWAGPNGEPMFTILKDSQLTISKEKGQLKISTMIRSHDGLVAELVNNDWKINPQESFDRNYNKNALEVRDKDGDVVLQVKLLNDRIQFQGKFYDEKGNGVAFVGRKEWNGSMIEMTGPNHPKLDSTIEPIFKYPSGLHMGELRQS